MSVKVTKELFLEQKRNPEYAERLALVWNLREEGRSAAEIETLTGIKSKSVWPLYRAAQWRVHRAETQSFGEYYGLSVRAENILRHANISSKQQLIQELRDGLQLIKLRNCGRGTVNELNRWCGLPLVPKLKPYKCPCCGEALEVKWVKSGARVRGLELEKA